MNLIIDIGNSMAKAACFDDERLVCDLTMPNTDLRRVAALARQYACSRAILSTVVTLDEAVSNQLSHLPVPLLTLSAQTPIPIKNKYRTPQTLGTDRLAAAVAAAMRFPGRDVLVVDAGTCITYELVTSAGEYLGGNISPGVHMRLEALHQGTSRLPETPGDGMLPLLGYDTDTAIRSGVRNGIRYEIEGYINELRKKYPSLLVLLTGGDSFSLDSSLKSYIFADRYLVLRGLNYILNYNDL